jgi:hypothetical protein
MHAVSWEYKHTKCGLYISHELHRYVYTCTGQVVAMTLPKEVQRVQWYSTRCGKNLSSCNSSCVASQHLAKKVACSQIVAAELK